MFFWKGYTVYIFQLCGLYSLFQIVNSAIVFQNQTQTTCKGMVPRKLFTKTGCSLDLAHGVQFTDPCSSTPCLISEKRTVVSLESLLGMCKLLLAGTQKSTSFTAFDFNISFERAV